MNSLPHLSSWKCVSKFAHSILFWAFLFTVAILLTACGKDPYPTSLQVMPAEQSISIGATVQFTAQASMTKGGNHPQIPTDMTGKVVWSSSSDSVATVDSAGKATGNGVGTATIMATYGGQTATSKLTVTGAGDPVNDLLSITIIPGSQTAKTANETAQFLAIGSFSSDPTTKDMTNQVVWVSSDVKVATINSSGLATVNSEGTTTITAIATASTGKVTTATATLTLDGATGGVKLPTLTVYKVGQGTGNVKGYDQNNNLVIDCGSGANCTGNFVLNSTVRLVAVPDADSWFGGWSANCNPPTSEPTGGMCTITMSNNDSVGSVFNLNQQ